MSKGFTLQNIWESKIPVENGSTFKFKSTVWRSTRIEGLRGPPFQEEYARERLVYFKKRGQRFRESSQP